MSPDHSAAAQAQFLSAESAHVCFYADRAAPHCRAVRGLGGAGVAPGQPGVQPVACRRGRWSDRSEPHDRRCPEDGRTCRGAARAFRAGDDDELLQVPTSPDNWSLDVVDLRADEDPESSAHAWMDRDMQTVVAVGGEEPLFHHALLRTGDESLIWYQRYHHSIIDGYGITLLVADVVERYADPDLETAAGPWPLDSLLAADREYRGSARFVADREFWLQQVIDAPEPRGCSLLSTTGRKHRFRQ